MIPVWAHTTARLAVIPLTIAALVFAILWLRGLPQDRKYRSGVFRWRG